MADAEGYVGEVLVAGFAAFAVELSVFAPQVAAAAIDFGVSSQTVAQAERTDEHIAVAAVFLNFGRDGDKGSGACLNVNWCSKFGTAAFAVDIGNGSVEFQFALVRHDVFDIQRQIGADNQRSKDNECNQNILHIVVLLV